MKPELLKILECVRLRAERDAARTEADRLRALLAEAIAERDEALRRHALSLDAALRERDEAIRQRDEARVQADRLRMELNHALTINATQVPGVGSTSDDRIVAAFRDIGASAEQIKRIRAIRRSAERFAAQREHDVNEWRGRPIVEAPNPTTDDLLSSILAAVESIRSDLHRASEARR